ncbi:rhomboid family intramembrane serine protease rho-7 isoform X2 [Calliopsis andreniformis]|uniref:rhomboid family intramembrane serine protease rho-7 isoform X2 n=1 Tax=Calliopsis andreniformis TaxID=337506 RepID=UPI003FCC92A3
MAVRPFLYLGDTVCKCVFTSVQFKPKLHMTKAYRQFKRYGRFKVEEQSPKTPFPNNYVEKGPLYFGKLWKPFAFTLMFSGTAFVTAAIWEYERIRKKTYWIINQYKQSAIYRTGWRQEMRTWWMNLTEGQKIFAPICFLNVLVYLSWRVPAFQKVMVRYFCANPASTANMYVLHSFCSLAVAALGKEQFVAFYLTSGVVSSFVSNLYKTACGFQNPSLGASGAVMGVLGFVCTQFPDTYLTIIFLPMYIFTAGMAIKTVMGLDILGCILRWQYFDHAAHLGGVLFGIFWQAWGNANIWRKREPVLALWHDLRGPSKS